MNKTNVIFILIDDMGWRDISCMGSTFYETPNIDRLRDEGMLFNNAYAACPVCSPTRASILSGKYPARLGLTDWINYGRESDSPTGHALGYLLDAPYIDHLPLEEKSLATTLKEAGYQTWHVGKWHLGREPYYPEKHGFEINIGGCLLGSPRGGYFSPWSKIPALQDVDVPEGTYLTDYLGDESIKLLRNRDKTRPFFLNVWPYQLHAPIQGKEEKIAKYKKKAITMGLDKIEPFEIGDLMPNELNKEKRVTRRVLQSDPVYAAMIESLDEWVGKILDELDNQGIADDTLVIFTSDNGGLATAEGSPTCNYPLSDGKGWTREGGIREPLLVRWPKEIRANSSCDSSVISMDFYPTILEALNLDLLPEQHCDGVSLLPLLKESGNIEREAIYWHYPHYGNQGDTPSGAVRVGDWKLIKHFEDDEIELYNLKEDISEKNNVVLENSDIKEKLLSYLENWQKEIHAKIPVRNKGFIPWSMRHQEKGFQPYD